VRIRRQDGPESAGKNTLAAKTEHELKYQIITNLMLPHAL